MKCLVFVKFLPGGSIAPDQFFSHLHARWGWYDEEDDVVTDVPDYLPSGSGVRSAVCLADIDSVQQLAIDLSIMPGAGIAGIEVVPVPDETGDMDFLNRLAASSMYN